MTILLPALAVAFAALCIWLTVRSVNRRERWTRWMAVALAVVLAYPLSYGPMLWPIRRVPRKAAENIVFAQSYLYLPLYLLCDKCQAINDSMSSYDDLWDDF